MFMKTSHLNILAATIVALPLAFAVNWSAPAQGIGECITGRQAQRAVDAGEIAQLPDAAAAAGVRQKIISSSAKVCDINGSPHWVVNVMDSYGESRSIS
ncbi:MAG: hypothetical protein Q8L54_05990, partial [Devosia sp.]|nr:hypothetical protein [Devosia sp.]